MTEFRVEVVRVTNVVKHPNADALSIARVAGDYPVVFQTGTYKEGDLAVYVPVDAVVPDEERWSFLGGRRRIRAKKLRGIFSMGLLTPVPELGTGRWAEGDDVAAALGIVKYEPPAEKEAPDDEDPGPHPHIAHYDIAGLRKYGALLVPGEEVWISEKLHGQNALFVHDGTRLHVRSRTKWKDPAGSSTWARIARRYGLKEKLAQCPGFCFFGEAYGNNSDMPYGVTRAEREAEGDRFALFDVLLPGASFTITASVDGKQVGEPGHIGYGEVWASPDELLRFGAELDIPLVPTLYRGPWNPELTSLAEGSTTLPGASHVREGIVVKPLEDRLDPTIGRVFLKLHGQGYLLRKDS